jgi:arylsulfatase A-like enzyme
MSQTAAFRLTYPLELSKLRVEHTQVHIPPTPDPEYTGTTRRGNFADLPVQLDAFTGRILDELDTLGIADDTIVVWASDNGADPKLAAACR